MLHQVEREMLSSIGTCTCWPRPVRSRQTSAMPIAEASIWPTSLSQIAIGTKRGSPAIEAFSAAKPASPWMTSS